MTSVKNLKSNPSATEKVFKYSVDEFADLQVLRYRIPDWDSLSFNQKSFLYYTSEAAKWGRDIYFDQNCKYNLPIRRVLEKIITTYKGDTKGKEYQNFMVYAKRFFFSNGMHHHYGEDKFVPSCTKEYFKMLMVKSGQESKCAELLPIIYNPSIMAMRRTNDTKGDMVANSAINFYEGNITQDEVNKFYAAQEVPGDKEPISYGLNTKLVKENGKLVEKPWKIGGIYSKSISKIVENLEKAKNYAETPNQKETVQMLIDFYKSGNLKDWDRFNIQWVKDSATVVDFMNGFVEDYNDPLGRKGAWEAIADFKDIQASRRTETISENAQWFEDHSPVDSRFKKKTVKGVTAKVINVTCIAGDCYPSTPIGINLPNADWIRKEYGSKSVTIANITDAYEKASNESPKSTLKEFSWDDAEVAFIKKYSILTDNLHTDLHECLGHASGQIMPGVSANALKEFSSALEEARADLFALYYLADPKLVELGLLPNAEAYKAAYISQIRNGIFTQFTRIELGKKNTEAHMQDRKLIAQWCYEKGLKDNVIEKRVKNGKTYFVINDYVKLRHLFGELLAEIQRIKSEGDYEAGKNLIETYAINIDPALHKEVLERYKSLNLKPYKGFINPDIVPVVKNGKTVNYIVKYNDNFLKQQLDYGKNYSAED
jgi:dipeptidyl-peptidase-3